MRVSERLLSNTLFFLLRALSAHLCVNLLQGIDLYFQRHDEQAVTCEDFFAAMRDANSADFANFLQW